MLSRAQDIRAVINNDNSAYSYYYRRQSDDATLTLSDGEVAELLDTYVGTEDTVEYTAPARFYAPTMRVSVVDGNPDLGLAVERGDDPGLERQYGGGLRDTACAARGTIH